MTARETTIEVPQYSGFPGAIINIGNTLPPGDRYFCHSADAVRTFWHLYLGALPEADTEVPPDPVIRGVCPKCGGVVVANLYHSAEYGYALRYECWLSLMPKPICDFFAVP